MRAGESLGLLLSGTPLGVSLALQCKIENKEFSIGRKNEGKNNWRPLNDSEEIQIVKTTTFLLLYKFFGECIQKRAEVKREILERGKEDSTSQAYNKYLDEKEIQIMDVRESFRSFHHSAVFTVQSVEDLYYKICEGIQSYQEILQERSTLNASCRKKVLDKQSISRFKYTQETYLAPENLRRIERIVKYNKDADRTECILKLKADLKEEQRLLTENPEENETLIESKRNHYELLFITLSDCMLIIEKEDPVKVIISAIHQYRDELKHGGDLKIFFVSEISNPVLNTMLFGEELQILISPDNSTTSTDGEIDAILSKLSIEKIISIAHRFRNPLKKETSIGNIEKYSPFNKSPEDLYDFLSAEEGGVEKPIRKLCEEVNQLSAELNGKLKKLNSPELTQEFQIF